MSALQTFYNERFIYSCPEYTNINLLFYMVLYFGSTCSVVSLLANLVILISLLRDGRRFSTYFMYLIMLAACDMLVCAVYIPVIVIDQVRASKRLR